MRTRWTGKQRLTDTYRRLDDLPLRDGEDALHVGWCELTTTDAEGNVLYRNARAGSQPIGAADVVAVVAAGRRRWKIENENNNTLKTKGYRFEHNYGHGKRHLANLLAGLPCSHSSPIQCSSSATAAPAPYASNSPRGKPSSSICARSPGTGRSTPGSSSSTSCARPWNPRSRRVLAGPLSEVLKFRTAGFVQ